MSCKFKWGTGAGRSLSTKEMEDGGKPYVTGKYDTLFRRRNDGYRGISQITYAKGVGRMTPGRALRYAVGARTLAIRISSGTCQGCRRRKHGAEHQRDLKHGDDESTRDYSPFPNVPSECWRHVSGKMIKSTAIPSDTSPANSNSAATRCNIMVHYHYC